MSSRLRFRPQAPCSKNSDTSHRGSAERKAALDAARHLGFGCGMKFFGGILVLVLARTALASDNAVIDNAQAATFVQLALKGIDREYPNKPGEVLRGAEDIMAPRAMHPAFFGCYDWHSSVHGHWL